MKLIDAESVKVKIEIAIDEINERYFKAKTKADKNDYSKVALGMSLAYGLIEREPTIENESGWQFCRKNDGTWKRWCRHCFFSTDAANEYKFCPGCGWKMSNDEIPYKEYLRFKEKQQCQN